VFPSAGEVQECKALRARRRRFAGAFDFVAAAEFDGVIGAEVAEAYFQECLAAEADAREESDTRESTV
jgi:hypothetical protein